MMNDLALERYAQEFEKLSSQTVKDLSEIMTEDIHFVDPFNDAKGIDTIKNIFDEMFESLDDARFTVTHAGLDMQDSSTGLLGWRLNANYRNKPYTVVGMSEIKFASDGRVSQHIDYWDAGQQFYEHLPMLGWLLRGIRQRLKVS